MEFGESSQTKTKKKTEGKEKDEKLILILSAKFEAFHNVCLLDFKKRFCTPIHYFGLFGSMGIKESQTEFKKINVCAK